MFKLRKQLQVIITSWFANKLTENMSKVLFVVYRFLLYLAESLHTHWGQWYLTFFGIIQLRCEWLKRAKRLVPVLQLHPCVGVHEPLHPHRGWEMSAKFFSSCKAHPHGLIAGIGANKLIHESAFYKTILFISLEY